MPETKTEKQPTTKRVVGVLSAIYFRQDEDPISGEIRRGPVTATFGQEIELVPSEVKRLEQNGALLPEGVKPEDAPRHHEAKLDRYRAERGDVEALARHQARVEQHRASQGGIVNVELDVENLTVTELAERIKDQKPNATDTVALAESDPRKAEKVLEAERVATGNSPRQGVESELQKIIDGGK